MLDEYEKKEYLSTTGRFMPQLFAVIVTKRHHTRFFPLVKDSRVNCDPRTVADSGVTHPVYFDFFFQSQYAPVGTAKLTYYFLLENDMNSSPRELQNFTNILCYSYVRATLHVGYVPATHFADRLCDRARCYLKDAYKELKKQIKDDAKEKNKLRMTTFSHLRQMMMMMFRALPWAATMRTGFTPILKMMSRI